MVAARVLALILAGGVTGHAETDVFMRAVGFAEMSDCRFSLYFLQSPNKGLLRRTIRLGPPL